MVLSNAMQRTDRLGESDSGYWSSQLADPADPAVAGFAHALMGEDPLADSDMRLVRVLEDVIDLLISRDVIRFTDLPQAAQSSSWSAARCVSPAVALNLLGGDDFV